MYLYLPGHAGTCCVGGRIDLEGTVPGPGGRDPVVGSWGHAQLSDSRLGSSRQVASHDDHMAGEDTRVRNGIAIKKVHGSVRAAANQAWIEWIRDVIKEGAGDHHHRRSRPTRAFDGRRGGRWNPFWRRGPFGRQGR